MQEKDSPTTWYVDRKGTLEGPYSTEEVMQLVMQGSVKLQSKLYNSDRNEWFKATDVFPLLHLPETNSTESNWQPPPRPADLTNTHVVTQSQEESIEYFTLLGANTKRGSLPKNTAGQKAPPTKPVATVQKKKKEKSEPTKPSPTLEIFRNTKKSILLMITQHKFLTASVATLGCVSVVVYSLISSWEQNRQRQPAAAVKPTPPAQVTSVRHMPSAQNDAIGSGRNPITRDIGYSPGNLSNAPTPPTPISPVETPAPSVTPAPQMAPQPESTIIADPNAADPTNSPVTPPQWNTTAPHDAAVVDAGAQPLATGSPDAGSVNPAVDASSEQR